MVDGRNIFIVFILLVFAFGFVVAVSFDEVGCDSGISRYIFQDSLGRCEKVYAWSAEPIGTQNVQSVVFTNVEFPVLNYNISEYEFNNNITFVIPDDGVYLINYHINWQNNVNGRRHTTLFQDSIPLIQCSISAAGTWVFQPAGNVCSYQGFFFEGSNLSILAIQNSGSNLTITGGSFSITRL